MISLVYLAGAWEARDASDVRSADIVLVLQADGRYRAVKTTGRHPQLPLTPQQARDLLIAAEETTR